MHGRHLTRSDSSWIFQTRVPWAFKTLQSLDCIRLNLGLLDKRAAQVAAWTLAVSARQALLNEVWGYNAAVTTHMLETHVYRLRQKIQPNPAISRLLLTEGGGYRLNPDGALA